MRSNSPGPKERVKIMRYTVHYGASNHYRTNDKAKAAMFAHERQGKVVDNDRYTREQCLNLWHPMRITRAISEADYHD